MLPTLTKGGAVGDETDHRLPITESMKEKLSHCRLPMASHGDADNAKDLSLDVGMMLRECGIVRQRRERPQKVRQIRLHCNQSINHLAI